MQCKIPGFPVSRAGNKMDFQDQINKLNVRHQEEERQLAREGLAELYTNLVLPHPEIDFFEISDSSWISGYYSIEGHLYPDCWYSKDDISAYTSRLELLIEQAVKAKKYELAHQYHCLIKECEFKNFTNSWRVSPASFGESRNLTRFVLNTFCPKRIYCGESDFLVLDFIRINKQGAFHICETRDRYSGALPSYHQKTLWKPTI